MRAHLLSVAAAIAAVAAAGACTGGTEPRASSPRVPHVRAEVLLGPTAAEPQLLVCPTAETESGEAIIGPEGGTFGVRGTLMAVPPGAVADSTLFQIVVPASDFMKVEIHAAGYDTYVFQRPVTVTINYARCGPDVPDSLELQGVYVDSANVVLERMGGLADTFGKKLYFATGHLSGYAVAF